MSDEPTTCCENCRWWDTSVQWGQDQAGVTGLCRVNPPIVNYMTGRAMWPFTDDADWCASFSKPIAPIPDDMF